MRRGTYPALSDRKGAAGRPVRLSAGVGEHHRGRSVGGPRVLGSPARSPRDHV